MHSTHGHLPADADTSLGCRAARRHALDAPCAVDVDGLGRVTLDVVNVSATGAFFACPLPLDHGQRVRCILALPDGTAWLAAGRVVRVWLSDTPGFAVAFDGITSDDRRRVDGAFAPNGRLHSTLRKTARA